MKLKKIGIVVVMFSALLLFISNCGQTQNEKESSHPDPVNPNTIKEARNLLDLLYEIEGDYILSGHHNYNDSLMQFHNDVKEIVGNYPVVWGADFSFSFENNNPDSVRNHLVEKATEMYNKGYIITLMWHSPPPDEGTSSPSDSIWIFEPGVSDAYWDSMTTAGTELNQQWRDQVDEIAGYLKKLEKAGVPILWRPYHEMNGMWFWWCNEKGEDGYQKLWKMMYDRFTNKHNLNNLIWVWNPNAPRDKEGDEAYPYEQFFPGKEYVDVLAADVYYPKNEFYPRHYQDNLKELAPKKPVAFGEVGKLPTPDVINEQEKWTWFMGWSSWIHKANSPDSVKMLYNDPKVITKNEIEKNEDGTYDIMPENE